MAQKKQVTLSQTKVGILVTVALVLFAALILQRSWGIHLFEQTVDLITYLPDVGGLKPGAPVWLAGIEIGRVAAVTLVSPEVYSGNKPIFRTIEELQKELDSLNPKDPNAANARMDIEQKIRDERLQLHYVEVTLEIQERYLDRISRDSEVSIESKGLIGDSFIEISPGILPEAPVRQGKYYLIEGVRTTSFREIMTGANDVVANFGVLSDQIRDIATKINPDKVAAGLSGTIQDIQGTLKEATATMNRATLLLDDMRQGQGTIGRLVADPQVYNRLNQALDRFNELTGELQSGQGTLAKLIHDPQLYDNAKETLHKAEIVMDRIDKGEGTLGRLSKDAALYDRTRQAVEKLASFVEQIDSGEGTLGKLLKDPSLYKNLDQSSAEITKFIYDLRQDPKKYLTIRFKIF
jgi:phospholipid/cholesterol/gamma-HCH transport system substrate-binding protein